MMETNEPFAFTFIIGTPPNLAVHDPLNDACVPQVYNATGLPKWGDPEDYPWTIGGLLAYNTEARMWCNHISRSSARAPPSPGCSWTTTSASRTWRRWRSARRRA
jgi:branched-chain amino acid transport system substrate-binding protein